MKQLHASEFLFYAGHPRKTFGLGRDRWDTKLLGVDRIDEEAEMRVVYYTQPVIQMNLMRSQTWISQKPLIID